MVIVSRVSIHLRRRTEICPYSHIRTHLTGEIVEISLAAHGLDTN
jgi:hypothetical protein